MHFIARDYGCIQQAGSLHPFFTLVQQMMLGCLLCRFRPLAICVPNVVKEFLEGAMHAEIERYRGAISCTKQMPSGLFELCVLTFD